MVQGGERELVLGIEDTLTTSGGPRRIPREDVAELCVQCIDMPAAINRYRAETPPIIHICLMVHVWVQVVPRQQVWSGPVLIAPSLPCLRSQIFCQHSVYAPARLRTVSPADIFPKG